jgi:hypothetical protein
MYRKGQWFLLQYMRIVKSKTTSKFDEITKNKSRFNRFKDVSFLPRDTVVVYIDHVQVDCYL